MNFIDLRNAIYTLKRLGLKDMTISKDGMVKLENMVDEFVTNVPSTTQSEPYNGVTTIYGVDINWEGD